jgi:GTP:adenosylcobinamide-phosphate guanylyltransferase
MVREFRGHSLVAVVPVGEKMVPTGLNVVADDVDEYVVFRDPLLAVNVNTPEDYDVSKHHMDDTNI